MQPPEPDTMEVIHDEVSARLERQRESRHRVDLKASFLVTVLLTSVPLGLWKAVSVDLTPARVLLLASAACAFLCLRVKASPDAPVPRRLAQRYGTASKAEVLDVLVAAKVETFEENEKYNKSKARWWRASAVSAALGLLAAFIAVYVNG